jgi:two-component system OmpR family response regulator/two-component system response regulator CpxR
MMPGLSGLELLQQVRPKVSTPVIMLTGKGDDIDRILGLEMGADDYLSKPANPRELLARIRAVLRRTVPVKEETNKQTLSVGAVNLTPARRVASVDETELQLTAAEFNVLALLMERAGQVASKEWLTEQVLHRKLTAYDRSIDVHVSRVRQKLEQAKPGLAEMIKTVRGEGYQMVVGEEG